MVMVYCEGPTEWYVIRKLNMHGILLGQLIEPDRPNMHMINSPTQITQSFITGMPTLWERFLLVYDRESHPTPQDFVNNQFTHLGTWIQLSYNIFCLQLSGRIVYLHVNDANSPNNYGDFDGYVWDLINRLGDNAAKVLFSLLPQYIQNIPPSRSSVISKIHTIGSRNIPDLMSSAEFPIQRSKGNIYAYITALQMAKSHVWFAEKLVDEALKAGFTNEVQNTFSSLIQAWNWIVGGTC